MTAWVEEPRSIEKRATSLPQPHAQAAVCPCFAVQAGALPGHWPHVTLALGQGFNLTAFALSLLLVFRTNSSYDRWWEGRKLWGGVVNRTRDFVRQVSAVAKQRRGPRVCEHGEQAAQPVCAGLCKAQLCGHSFPVPFSP